MKAIILAGGFGTRLNSHKTGIPKALVEISGKPLIIHQIEMLKKYGLGDIRLSLGFGAEKIIEEVIDSGLNFDYVVEDEPLGTGGAIKFASRDLEDWFLCLNGDILTDLDFSKFVKFHFQDELTQTILGVWQKDAREFGLLKTNKNFILDFLEKPKEKTQGFINGGVYVLDPKIFKNFKKEKFSIEKDLFPLLAKEKKLTYCPHNGFWIDVGTPERLELARNILALK